MPITKISPLKLGAALAVAFISALALATMSRETIPGKGPQRLAFKANPGPAGFGQAKAHQGIRVAIEALDDITDDSNIKVRLHARVQMSRAADAGSALTYSWSFPSSVQLISGNLKGMIPTLEAGEVWEQEIVVTGLTAASDPQRLKLEIMAQMSGQSIAGQGYFMTRPMQRDLTRAKFDPEAAREGRFQKTSSLGSSESEVQIPEGIHF